ncbi:hypothetical protein [Halobacillus sp. H74]|uniref:hypothetical protein n=1 Tax=Halobacillus sp. H74 TaxID=3457436 RepID=UPI003FCDEC83
MTDSTEFTVNLFKSYIMNHLFSSVPCPLEAIYKKIKEEIIKQEGRIQELENLEEAFFIVHEEITGKRPVPSRA